MQFDLPKEQSSIIKVIGVGGGGGHAVNHMYKQGIRNVNFVICNTDSQDLETSPVPNKIQLGPNLTEGRGAGSKPEVGMKATEESLEDIKTVLGANTKMVFVTAGMGGGTGTGGAPVIAKLARDMDILTVGIVTTPFAFEGPQRNAVAMKGIEAMKEHVDTFLVISNDKLREMYGDLDYSVAFGRADDILTTAAKSIAEIITVPGYVNVDFEDVNTVMRESGAAIMGSGVAEGEERALHAVEAALNSPLLNDSDIKGARNILLNINSGTKEVKLDEVTEITDYIRNAAGRDTNLIFGNCDNELLNEKLSVTVIATGFEGDQHKRLDKSQKVVVNLGDEVPDTSEGVTETPNEEVEVPQENIEKESPIKERKQVTIEFDLNEENEDNVDKHAPMELKEISPSNVEQDKEDNTDDNEIDGEDNAEKRKAKLREISMKLSPNAVNEMEKKPAYLRRKVPLEDQPHSSESNVSKYTLDTNEEEEEQKPKLKENNSFLHDNVD